MWRWILGCCLVASSVSAQDGSIEESAVEPTPSTSVSSHESPRDSERVGSDATGAASDPSSDGSAAIGASSAGDDARTESSAPEPPNAAPLTSDVSNDAASHVSSASSGPSEADANAASPLRQRFVFLRPGWMPHVTVGYRAHTIRFGGEREKESSRGITSGVVFPIVASGGDASRVRFALAAGVGIDFGHYRHRELDPIMFGVPTLTRGYVQRTRYFYGQVGGLLRVSFGRNALVTSLLWLPGRRTRSTKPYEDYANPFPDDADDAMLARGRFSLALVRSHFHAGFFVGLGHASLPDERGVEIEYALQIGTGW